MNFVNLKFTNFLIYLDIWNFIFKIDMCITLILTSTLSQNWFCNIYIICRLMVLIVSHIRWLIDFLNFILIKICYLLLQMLFIDKIAYWRTISVIMTRLMTLKQTLPVIWRWIIFFFNQLTLFLISITCCKKTFNIILTSLTIYIFFLTRRCMPCNWWLIH